MSLYDHAGTLIATVTDVPPSIFPLRVQLRFGGEAFASLDVVGLASMDVSDVLVTQDATTLFTDDFASNSGPVTGPFSDWTYADTETTDATIVLCQPSITAGVLSFAATGSPSVDPYEVAWSWLSKEDLFIPEPASDTTYTFSWVVTMDTGFGGAGRGTGLGDTTPPYPYTPFEMLLWGFNIYAATGDSEPFSPYGDFEFGPDLATAPGFTGAVTDFPWGYSLVFTNVSSGLHVWARS